MSKLLLVSNDRIGSTMAGPGIRYFNFARELAVRHDVTLVAPNDVDIPIQGVEIIRSRDLGSGRFRPFAKRFDALVAQQLRPLTMTALARASTDVVYDLYVPYVSENLPLFGADRDAISKTRYPYSVATGIQQVALASGDAFVCAGERQRDLWLGALAAFDRIGLESYVADPTLRSVIDVVPFGMPDEPARQTERVLKGVVPGIRETDKVLLWAGGVWNWFDPLTVIRAVAELSRERDDVKLYFLGLRHPNAATPTMEMNSRALALSDELGLTKRHVFFNFGWVPYELRQNYLLEADIGVSSHFDDIETRFSFRTRLLDHFWARLPTVCTEGDELGDLVAREGLGHTVAPEDVTGWVAAIERTLDETERKGAHQRFDPIHERFAWSRSAERLEGLIERPRPPLRPPSGGPFVGARLTAQTARAVLRQRGAASVLREGMASLRSPTVP